MELPNKIITFFQIKGTDLILEGKIQFFRTTQTVSVLQQLMKNGLQGQCLLSTKYFFHPLN